MLELGTKQDVFNKVALHLMRQSKKSMGHSAVGVDTCQYISDDGSRCAVGCLLSEEIVEKYDLEGKNWKLFFHKAVFGSSASENQDCELLQYLQLVHDTHDERDWYTELKRVAGMFNLNSEILEGFTWSVAEEKWIEE